MLALLLSGCSSSESSPRVTAAVPATSTQPGSSEPSGQRFSGWSSPVDIDINGEGANNVSCVSGNFCIAVSFAGNAYIFSSGQWGPAIQLDQQEPLDSVSCASSMFCAAADEAGNVWFYRSGKWGPMMAVAPNVSLTVSCATSTFCGAVGGQVAATFDGSSWSAPQTVDPSSDARESMGTLSCVGSGFCLAGDLAGNAYIYENGKWTGPNEISSSLSSSNLPGVDSLSCASPNFCVASGDVGSAAHVFVYNGTNWTDLRSVIPGQQLLFVSCTSITFCLAVSGTTGVTPTAIFNGKRWTAGPTAQDESVTEMRSISCGSPLLCAIAGSGYQESTYAPTPTEIIMSN